MRQRNWGRIINVASTHGLVASVEKAAYVAAKHGVIGLDQGRGAGNCDERNHLQRDLSRLGADAAGRKADQRAGRTREGISVDQAKSDLLSEKQPSHEFATPEQSAHWRSFCAPMPPPKFAARHCRSMAAGPRNSEVTEGR